MAHGKVYLVGAGPGDGRLLTVWGKELLERADVVVYDRLIDESILSLLREDAERVDVGKAPGKHTLPQEEIHRLLVERAREGKMVVRLKGGDPFVFGRGSEEAWYVRSQGIEVEVVPGVTSAIAVPAQAGIPVTHRGVSRGFWVLTGSEGLEEFPWSAIAHFSGTLVFLMGMANFPHIVQLLLTHGKSPATPVAVIQEGGGASQRTVVGSLEDIREKVSRENLTTPAVVVIGEVVKLREVLPHRERLLLHGKRILFTGSVEDEKVFAPLRERGAVAEHCPLLHLEIDYRALKEVFEEMQGGELLIFASKHAVWAWKEGMRRYRFDVRHMKDVVVAALGRKTAQGLEEMGIYPDYLPQRFSAQDLLAAIPWKEGQQALVLTSDVGKEEWLLRLASLPYPVEVVAICRNTPNEKMREPLRRVIEKGVDAIVYTSPSTLASMELFVENLPELHSQVLVAAIGPTTAFALQRRGFRVDLVPEEHTVEGLVQALIKKWGGGE